MAKSTSQRVRDSQARTIASGGMRLGLLLPAETAAALDALVNAGYAPSRSAAVRRAIAEAHQMMDGPSFQGSFSLKPTSSMRRMV